ncbi:unnamed protein product [Protopolystoma xenopodis]|uniref:Uncharacterized protein n=1 Tax=Protopolystoma xenopodis TaxID=117903 RepID=A0A448WDX8_9PLAT|nr:unnamed protein product [Protopolystoma xenopodis]
MKTLFEPHFGLVGSGPTCFTHFTLQGHHFLFRLHLLGHVMDQSPGSHVQGVTENLPILGQHQPLSIDVTHLEARARGREYGGGRSMKVES